MSKNYFDIIKQYWDKPVVTEPLHSQVSPNAHTADLLTRSRYRAEGAQTERERIIKLLEESPRLQPTTGLFLEFTEGYIAGFEDAIAITKVKVKGDSVSALPLEDVVTIHKSLKKGEQK